MTTSSSCAAMRYWCGGMKGLRLNPRRFSVARLRANFLNLDRILRRWRNSYKNALRRMRRNLGGGRTRKQRSSVDDEFRLTVMAHSNSFCSDAIADCVEFIKRNSVSTDARPNRGDYYI